ncbi:MAG TPA: protein kinase [Solirubrobacteraceae bacterium]
MDGTRRRLAGRYELLEVIGRGGMGVVYRATDLVLGRGVAVKVLPAEFADGEPTRIARFEREARLAASLTHPGVVAVYDSGVDEATRFIVMECATGRSLAAILGDHAPLEPAHAAWIAEQVADALAAAHAAGLVHRDIKPANVMVTDDGQVKVLDFGIARAIDGTTLTHTASVLGSAGYMAPEQALGGRADERSDIYSLGCLLYAMLSGRAPFTGEADVAVLHQHVNADPHPLSHTNPRVSQALDALVMRMLAKSPDARPQSAAQVRALLAATVTEPPATPATSPTARSARAQETAVTRVLSAGVRVKHHRRAAAAALPGLALLLALVVALSTDRGSPPPAPRRGNAASNRTQTRKTPPAGASHVSVPTTATHTAASAPAGKPTIAEATGALTSLITQDVESGGIDQPAAQQITNKLTGALGSYEMGHIMDAQHKLSDLAQMVSKLTDQQRITPATAAALDTPLANLSSALARSQPVTPSQQPGPPPGPGEEPPGRNHKPPGQAKNHDAPKGHPQGD